MHRLIGRLLAVALATSALASFPARADTTNFEMNGKIYTKWLWKNDDSRGCLSLSNPFWPDNIGGGNGVCSEFELNIKGRVSKYVTTGVRLKSRFGALWQNWWENGDVRWDYPNQSSFHENTSGETLGLNHAQYIKLRGAFIRAALPIPTVRWVHIGASDFGMFNEWTVGKSRYIDRDNGNGVFIEGEALGVRYHTGALALPKLFVGPRWNSGLADADPLAGFWGQDWAYAFKLSANPLTDLQTSLTFSYIHDWEADRDDPDVTGDPSKQRGADHAVSLEPRFTGLNATWEAQYAPMWADWFAVSGLVAIASNNVNPEYATNAVKQDQGFSPVLYLVDEAGNPRPATDGAYKALVEVFDPLGIGLSFKAEYFNIGSEYNALFGARREADVLLTDGFLASGFIQGGQLPTLNLANEFVDFDEPWYESAIGWHGATGLLEYVLGSLNTSLEYTFLTFNTNAQGRDVESQYPDFLYTDGFTDPQAFTADFDYSNVYDRGRDPRSVYAEFKDRRAHIAVLKGDYQIPLFNGIDVGTKLKLILDQDDRKLDNADDNYDGRMYLAYLYAKYRWTDELMTLAGYEIQYWDEKNRSGSQETGFFDYETTKHTARVGASYSFGGLAFNYMLEYFHKDLERNRPGTFDQSWRVLRSKATVEASW